MSFVNPYTFVSFPKEVRRRPPLMHTFDAAVARERYSGRLQVTWALKSPLAIPVDGAWGLGEGGDPDTPVVGSLRIPGASAKGAIRSAHEALFAGCARIIDENFTPVYRELMTTKLLDGWTLGVVVSADADVASRDHPNIQIFPCSAPVMWVRGAGVLQQAGRQRLPQTGDFIEPVQPMTTQNRANTFRAASAFRAVDRGDQWLSGFRRGVKDRLAVILVTDTSARDADMPYYWATARPDPAEGLKPVTEAALDRFRQRLRGADLVKPEEPPLVDVPWPPGPERPGPAVARRRSVDGVLRQGDVVWIKMLNGEISDIKLSLGWRTPTTGRRTTLISRIPDHVHPCGSLDHGLCLSCTVFGSIDATKKQEAEGRQDAYAGHVRFGDITGECTDGIRNVKLAPLSSPHPGAGMYYLDAITSQEMGGRLERPDHPTRWDSAAGESKGPRSLRGRKFYWHSDPSDQADTHHLATPRFRAQPGVHTHEEVLTSVHLVRAATLTQTITFDGLDAAGLGSLLATLEPARLLGEGNYGLHLGRGKPLGLGSVQASVTMEFTSISDRYSPQPQNLTELPMAPNQLARLLTERCGNLQATIDESRKVFALDGLGDQAVDVTYPTTRPWSQFGSKEFHQSFEFFQQNSGQVRKQNGKLVRGKWSPLPLASAIQQAQG